MRPVPPRSQGKTALDHVEDQPADSARLHDVSVDSPVVVRDIDEEFGGRLFHLVTRLDREPPPAANISTAHCLAFDGDQIVLALHANRGWTVPGGHLEDGESAETAMRREALEEAGAVVINGRVFAHEQIDPYDGVAVDPRYPVPAFQVFFVARVVSLGEITATDECSEARLFAPDEARVAEGWVQRNRPLYEAALRIALTESP